MKTGTKIGLIGSISGLVLGIYFSVTPLVANTLMQSLPPQQLGTYAAVIGAILGLSCALIGVVYRRFQQVK